jgi:hypothetical protein
LEREWAAAHHTHQERRWPPAHLIDALEKRPEHINVVIDEVGLDN